VDASAVILVGVVRGFVSFEWRLPAPLRALEQLPQIQGPERAE
jgi:hypothetical protein